MKDRLSRNGRSTPQPDAASGEYVKNEVDVKLDYINDLWMKVEKQLLKKEPPRRITCNYLTHDVGEDGDVTERRYLGIQRHAGKWRLCYAITWNKAGEDNLSWKPIVECDIDTRTDATDGIVHLKREVANTRTIFIPRLDGAINKLERALFDEGE